MVSLCTRRRAQADSTLRVARLCCATFCAPRLRRSDWSNAPTALFASPLKKAYSDGTVAVDMDPLSLLCRLATSVPPPRFHTIHYAGVLAAASLWRSCVTPALPPTAETVEPEKRVRKSGYRPWAELLERTFAVDVYRTGCALLTCPSCQGRMRLLAVVRNPLSIARYLAAVGELTEVPGRSPPRAPPYWKSQVLRRQALGDEDQRGDSEADVVVESKLGAGLGEKVTD